MLSTLKNDFLSIHRTSIITETNLPFELKEGYPNGNLILHEDCQKKEVRWRDIKSFLRAERIGEVYRSYSNDERHRYVCRPSRQNEIHNVFIGPN